MSLPPSLADVLGDVARQHADVVPAAIGARGNDRFLDLRPEGVDVEWLPADAHPGLVDGYLALNRLAFPSLPLPAWVLSDVYLLPGCIAALVGPAARLPDDVRGSVGLHPDDRAVLAAWVGLPTVEPGVVAGVSLLSFVRGLGFVAKRLGVAVHRATKVRGVAQWTSPSIRTHVRLGPMRIVGSIGRHELAGESFTYETVVAPAEPPSAVRRQPSARWPAQKGGDLLQRVASGERLSIIGTEGPDLLLTNG